MKDYFKEFNINPNGLLPEEIEIINDWHSNYTKYDFSVHLLDDEEDKIYKEHIDFLKKEYQNPEFYKDLLILWTDEASNYAAVVKSGDMRGWILFFSEDGSARTAFRSVKNFYEKVKNETITDVSSFNFDENEFRNHHRTSQEIEDDQKIFDNLLKTISQIPNKHDQMFYIEVLLGIVPPNRVHQLGQFLEVEHLGLYNYEFTYDILKIAQFYNHNFDSERLYNLGVKAPAYIRNVLKEMGIKPRQKFLWWEKW